MKPKVLVICSGNSQRSQVAEGVLRAELGDYIDVYSAGTQASYVHPLALGTLADAGISTKEMRSKSIQEFIGQEIDLVITVCDNARFECPILPGAKKTIHKGYRAPVCPDSGAYAEEVFARMRDKMRRELSDLVIKELNLQTT